MFKNIHLKSLLIAVIAIFTSCEKDEPKPTHEEEVITTLELVVTNQGDNTKKTYEFEAEHDHENESGNQSGDHGEHVEVELANNTTYKFEIRFLNESDPNNVEDVTEEIIEEKDEHQIFFALSDASVITITAASDDIKDSSNNPIHLKTIWETTTTGEVDVELYLIHEPTSKTGTKRADFGGATDVEIEFEAHIE